MAGFYGFVVLFDACVHVLFFEKKLNNSVHDHGQKPLLSTVRDTPSGHGYVLISFYVSTRISYVFFSCHNSCFCLYKNFVRVFVLPLLTQKRVTRKSADVHPKRT